MKSGKQGFLGWLMFALLFFCMGWIPFLCWGIFCLAKTMVNERNEEETIIRKYTPVDKRPDIVKMNTKEYLESHLTEDELSIIRSNPNHIKFAGRYKDGTAKFRFVNVNKDFDNKNR